MATTAEIVTRLKSQLSRNGHSKFTGLDTLIYQVIHDAILDLAAEFPKAGEWRAVETVTVAAGVQNIAMTKTWLTIEAVYNETDDWPLVEWPRPQLEAYLGKDRSDAAPRYYTELNATTLLMDVEPLVSTDIEIQGWELPTEQTSPGASAPDISAQWHSLITYMALDGLAPHLKDPDLSMHYGRKAQFYKHMFGRRIQRKLMEQSSIVQTMSEHILSPRISRNRRRHIWDT